MATKLTEIAKGSVKGLAGFLSILPMGVGIAAADGLHDSIETKEGRTAYNTTIGTLLATTITALYSVGN